MTDGHSLVVLENISSGLEATLNSALGFMNERIHYDYDFSGTPIFGTNNLKGMGMQTPLNPAAVNRSLNIQLNKLHSQSYWTKRPAEQKLTFDPNSFLDAYLQARAENFALMGYFIKNNPDAAVAVTDRAIVRTDKKRAIITSPSSVEEYGFPSNRSLDIAVCLKAICDVTGIDFSRYVAGAVGVGLASDLLTFYGAYTLYPKEQILSATKQTIEQFRAVDPSTLVLSLTQAAHALNREDKNELIRFAEVCGFGGTSAFDAIRYLADNRQDFSDPQLVMVKVQEVYKQITREITPPDELGVV